MAGYADGMCCIQAGIFFVISSESWSGDKVFTPIVEKKKMEFAISAEAIEPH